MTVICKNHQPIAVAKTLKEAQNMVNALKVGDRVKAG